ncbi:Type IV pilus biogenesis and competence protein PilQ precursor [Neorhodopirellula pilleata]|uniref:Type IV pilus biogenesis and competence protein PilQ n=2 Tax=Neorhodopirellula pilleata TaxID=2714738 RepID=A0A5C6ATQ6_9BACT|nr:Type IV pilus biogenesis and competence protein PilQ precursor [Neorhodopirellula pilleata]
MSPLPHTIDRRFRPAPIPGGGSRHAAGAVLSWILVLTISGNAVADDNTTSKWRTFNANRSSVIQNASMRSGTDGVVMKLAAATETELLPLLRPLAPEGVTLTADAQDRVNLIATETSLSSLLRMIAEHHQLNLVIAPGVDAAVTVSIRNAHLDEVLDAIVHIAGFHWHRSGNLLYVTSATATSDPRLQGRRVEVYPLDYVKAVDAQTAITGMLSPLGNVVINESDAGDQQKTRELLIVDDTPDVHQRIAEVIARLNRPPRQVLVEAHVLQVKLGENNRHGINLSSIARLGGSRISLGGVNPNAFDTGPGMVVQLEGTDLNGLIQCIQENTDSRTLASPKVSIINQQEAKIQIGRRLPYTEITNTDNGNNIQNVKFLEIGIILTVTPVITDDGNILMTVLPKVSDGFINDNQQPEEDVTEVSTTVLIPDGGGLIIGGLIEEKQIHSLNVVPGLHRIPVLGKLFVKEETETDRNELIVALVTHVVGDPCAFPPRFHEQQELQQVLPEYANGVLGASSLPFESGPIERLPAGSMPVDLLPVDLLPVEPLPNGSLTK